MRLILTSIVCMTLALPAVAKPPLREVSEIDDGLMAIAIADEIRKNCDDLQPRMVRAYRQIKALGYSETEIDDYVKSDKEKKRMRGKAEIWLTTQGVNPKDTSALCKFGRDDISRGGPVGYFLR